MANPEIMIKVKDFGDITVELYPDYAKNTVNNFLTLASNGFYNGLIFHRVIKGFMVQGGCPLGKGLGDAGYKIRGEFSKNGFNNEHKRDLKHQRGVISMARSMMPNSASSQFFIMHQDAPHLDGQYASFGMVVKGIEVVDSIANTACDGSDRPLSKVVIESVIVNLNGYEIAPVEKM